MENLQQMSQKTKLKQIMMINIVLLFSILFNACAMPKEKQIIVLPENYKGWFAIVYSCDCGEEKTTEDGVIRQLIPANGILLVNYPRPKGVNIDFCYGIGNETRLISSINKDIAPTSDSLTFSTTLAKFSFEGKSVCSKATTDFYEHDIVYYCFRRKNEGSQKYNKKEFDEKLRVLLQSNN